MKLGWCMAGQHAECWGTTVHTMGRSQKTECACSGKGHTTPHLKAPLEDDEKVVKRGTHF